MAGYDVCIPVHITALYVFLIVNVLLLVNITLVDANVFVTGQQNETRRGFYDLPANFGPDFPEGGLVGYTVRSEPINGCTRLTKPPHNRLERPLKWIAVIQRGGCVFDMKVLNAQNAGYGAVIVYNVNSSSLLPMGGDPSNLVQIPSCFVGSRDGYLLSLTFNYTSGFFITIDNDVPFDGTYYLFPLAVVLGICFILMLVFMIAKWLRDIHKKRKSRLSKKQLNKVPTKKFKKGDDYDVCAVCLDDYEEGQVLRVLPCSHVYHIKCIDPWLLQNKPTCPICKRKVIACLPDPETDQQDSDDDEVTPLLRQGTSGRPTSFGATNPVTRHPSTLVYEDDSDATDDSQLSDYDEGATGGDTGHVTEAEVNRKSGLPDDDLPIPDGATEQTVDNISPTTSGEPLPSSANASVAGVDNQGADNQGADIVENESANEIETGSDLVPEAVEVAPPTPLEPEVIVQSAGRLSINNDRDFDGVV